MLLSSLQKRLSLMDLEHLPTLVGRTKPWMYSSPRHRRLITMQMYLFGLLNLFKGLKGYLYLRFGLRQLTSGPTVNRPWWTTHSRFCGNIRISRLFNSHWRRIIKHFRLVNPLKARSTNSAPSPIREQLHAGWLKSRSLFAHACLTQHESFTLIGQPRSRKQVIKFRANCTLSYY